MPWFPFLLLVVINGVHCVVAKKVSLHLPVRKILFVQYIFSFLFMVVIWAIFDQTMFSLATFWAVGVGIALLNYLGAYCSLMTTKINMSRTALFSPLISLLSSLMFVIFLGEYVYLNWLVGIGFFLHLVAIFLFRLGKAKDTVVNDRDFTIWLIYTISWIVIQAVVLFFIKLAAGDISKMHFLVCWYAGSLIFSCLVFVFPYKDTVTNYRPAFVYLVPALAAGIVATLACQYWIAEVHSGISYVSFVALNGVFTPAMVGWAFFGEGKKLSVMEGIGFMCGLTAALLIIFAH